MSDVPLLIIFLVSALFIVVMIELGYLLGKAFHKRSTEEKESPVSAIAGTILALSAFILAFSFGMVSDRYDARKELVRDQANAIRTAFTRSDFLPSDDYEDARLLYDQYVALLVDAGSTVGNDDIDEDIRQTYAIEDELWDMAVRNARLDMNSDVAALYIESINEMISVKATRVAVAVQARLPDGLWVLLYGLIALGMIAMGYQTAIAESRRTSMMAILAVAFSLVIVLIAALDNPESSYLPVSQQPLIDLQTWMELQ
jgi:hypothetical protein